MTDLYSIEVETLDGKKTTLAEHRGKVLLIVNTASRCGYTPQYAGLERLYERHRERGLVVLGFPCNQFGLQEPGTASEVGAFCESRYGVKFPMHAKIDVNGAHAHPLFKRLKHEAKGFLGWEAIKWNFTKFLVDRNGVAVRRFGTRTRPEELEPELEKFL